MRNKRNTVYDDYDEETRRAMMIYNDRTCPDCKGRVKQKVPFFKNLFTDDIRRIKEFTCPNCNWHRTMSFECH